MRKLMAGAVAAAVLSWAHGAQAAESAKEERREAADATKAEVQQEGREAQEQAREAGREAQGTMQRETGQQAASGQQQEKKHPLFEGKNNFDLDGKISKVSPNSITIQRDDLPPATLHVSPNTKIELSGEKVSAQQLKRGQDVKASFNLQGDKPQAVEINAEKLEQGAQQEMREQKQESQKEMQERKQESQQK